METSTLGLYKQISDSKVKFLDLTYLSTLSGVVNRNTLYKIAERLVNENVLTKLTRGKFLVPKSNTSDFEVANYLYNPSYISLETALSYYGILSQFTYTITSVTTKKSKNIQIAGKQYQYSQIKQAYFNGYVKRDEFLIATKEKALFDTLYFSSKGLINIDFAELDVSQINLKLLKSMIYETKDTRLISKFKRFIL